MYLISVAVSISCIAAPTQPSVTFALSLAFRMTRAEGKSDGLTDRRTDGPSNGLSLKSRRLKLRQRDTPTKKHSNLYQSEYLRWHFTVTWEKACTRFVKKSKLWKWKKEKEKKKPPSKTVNRILTRVSLTAFTLYLGGGGGKGAEGRRKGREAGKGRDRERERREGKGWRERENGGWRGRRKLVYRICYSSSSCQI